MRSVDFKAVFAGVAGARHNHCFAVHLKGLNGVEHQFFASQAEHFLNHGFRFRTLHGKLSVVVALVVDVHVVALSLFVNPSHVFIDVGGVNHNEEVAVGHLIHQQVVDHATVRVAHHAVVYLAIRSAGDVVSENVVHKFLGVGAGDAHLAHVRNVEHATMLAYCIMFIND